MSCYPFEYTCPSDEMKEELEIANYQLTVDGLEFTPVIGRKKTVRRYIYKAFLKTGVFGLDALSFLFSCPRHIVIRILRYGTRKS